MQQEQTNYLSMVSAVLAGMDEKKVLWTAEEEIVGQVAEIKAEYDLVDAKMKKTEGMDISGYTNAKNKALRAIVNKTFKLIKKASAFAKKKSDLVLLPIVNLSQSALSRGMEKEVVSRCAAIVEQITKRLPLMPTFKVTSLELTTISGLITDYNKKYDERSSTQGEKTTIFDEIETHFSNLHDQLDILDDLVEGIMEDESFIALHKSLRIVKDYGQNKTAPNKPKP